MAIEKKIAIVGAGVAGLSAAEALSAAGFRCTIYEKSRGVGGRMATRRSRDGVEFDHGAQFFTARSAAFRHALTDGAWASSSGPWAPSGGREGIARHVGVPAMTSPAKAIAQSMDIQHDVRIDSLRREGGEWILDGTGLTTPAVADVVIVACPSPQAHALTVSSPTMQAALANVEMVPCWALMAAFSHPLAAGADVYEPEDEVFSWIARNNSKPGRSSTPETWVAHAHPEWSKTFLELDKEQAVDRLYPEFWRTVGCQEVEASYVTAHRWRFARVQTPLGEPFLADESQNLFAIGDWCLGPRVECAFESGRAVAAHLGRR